MSTRSTDQDSTIDNLLMLPADRVQYNILTTSVLSALATQTVDPFIATSALGELAQRDAQDTVDAAVRILSEKIWDPHLAAFALTLLYDRDPTIALLHMQKLIADCSDPTLLAAMMENVLADPDRFHMAEWQQLAHEISHHVAALGPDSFDDAEQRQRFLDQFGDKTPLKM